MSSLLVAIALSEKDNQLTRNMDIFNHPYLLNLPSITTSEMTQPQTFNDNYFTETPETDEFSILTANTPKRFANMVVRNFKVRILYITYIF